ncbi:MAG: penicillin-binding protein 1B [Pseudomonadota bacterium]
MANKRRAQAKKKRSPKSRRLVALAAIFCLCLAIPAGYFVSRLSSEIRQKFDGKRWSLPAIVYARPLELYPGLELSPEMLEEELQLSGYRRETKEKGAGSFARNGSMIRLVTRDFHYPSGPEPSRQLTITFAAEHIATLTTGENNKQVTLARLDPVRIGSFHPLVHEDRLILSREEIPRLLVETLLAVEDRNFYSHHGIALLGMARALLANIRAGKTVQGGSTLTQQLVKNLFLNRERTLWRKAQEAVMAPILEYYYSKDEILTTYVNEVFLGQDDNRAVHGFGLASQFYFRRDVQDLRVDQIAVLVGMVKGPTYYDPRRNPENCLARRNVVLESMTTRGLLSKAAYTEALARPVTEVGVQKNGFNRFPAFLELVKQQLSGEYREEDLKTNGLRILTTLDPQVQYQVEKNLQETVRALESKLKYQRLEGAVIITGRENGEVLALAGGKNPLLPGFNRALQAKRPIGSLVKPAVYLAALKKGYNLASPLEDNAVSLNIEGSGKWHPENYDHKEHGRVPLFAALANSYNLATVHLGMEVGLGNVLAAIHDLGYRGDIKSYPSVLLGAVDMSPFEVAQMYQTIAAGGFYTALRAISSIIAADHSLVNRYGLAVEQRFAPDIVFLLTHAMQRVVSEGTATALLSSPLRDYAIAGKTGTSDNLKDSWFAGFTGDHLTVVWLGRDDNTSIRLSGSAGALRVWEKIMRGVVSTPLRPVVPDGISWATYARAQLSASGNGSTQLPFMTGSQPVISESPASPPGRQKKGETGVFETISGWFK